MCFLGAAITCKNECIDDSCCGQEEWNRYNWEFESLLTADLSLGSADAEMKLDIQNQTSFAHVALLQGILVNVRFTSPSESLKWHRRIFCTILNLSKHICGYEYQVFSLFPLWFENFISLLKQCKPGDESILQKQDLSKDEFASDRKQQNTNDANYQATTAFASKEQSICHHFSNLSETSELITFCCDSTLVIELKLHLHSNWEHPVEGVPELVHKTLHLFLEAINLENYNNVEESINERGRYYTDLFQNAMNQSWNISAKYQWLSPLLHYLSIEELFYTVSVAPRGTMEAMKCNQLSKAAARFYDALLLELKCQEKTEGAAVETWCKYWLEFLVYALGSSEELQHANTVRYLLPSTLKAFPCVYKKLESSLCAPCGACTFNISKTNTKNANVHKKCCKLTRRQWLRSSVALTKAGRQFKFITGKDLKPEPLREGLFHNDDVVRSTAFAVICISPTKAEPVNKVEMSLLQESLPFNMKIDSAPFRCQSVTLNLK